MINKLFGMNKTGSTIIKKVQKAASNDEGVAAVEFALVAPLLLLLFLGTVETSYAVSVDRKLSRVASAVADLVTQSKKLTENNIDEFMTIANKIMAPYDTLPCMVVTGITIENDEAKVAWSQDNSAQVSAQSNGVSCSAKTDLTAVARRERAVNSLYPVPNAIKINDTFLVATEIELDHNPIVGFFGYANGGLSKDTSAIILNDQILLRPRSSPTVEIE